MTQPAGVKVKDLKGFSTDKHKHSWIENFDVGGKFCTICGMSIPDNFDKNSGHYQNGFIEGASVTIEKQGQKTLRLNREKTANVWYETCKKYYDERHSYPNGE